MPAGFKALAIASGWDQKYSFRASCAVRMGDRRLRICPCCGASGTTASGDTKPIPMGWVTSGQDITVAAEVDKVSAKLGIVLVRIGITQ